MNWMEIFWIIVIIYVVYCIFFKKDVKEKKQIKDSNLTHEIIKKVLNSNYIDIFVYRDCVQFSGHDIRFKEEGYENLNTSSTKVLANEILNALPNKQVYTIEKITDISGGSSDGLAGVRHALGDYSSDSRIVTLGYKIHNKNFDGRYLKVWNKNTGKYDTWDSQEQRWVYSENLKKW